MNRRFRISVTVAAAFLFVTSPYGCKGGQSGETLVSHDAVKQVKEGMSETSMLAIMGVPPGSKISSEASVLGTKPQLITVWWFTWHYDADKDVVISTLDGEVTGIHYSIRMDPASLTEEASRARAEMPSIQ